MELASVNDLTAGFEACNAVESTHRLGIKRLGLVVRILRLWLLKVTLGLLGRLVLLVCLVTLIRLLVFVLGLGRLGWFGILVLLRRLAIFILRWVLWFELISGLFSVLVVNSHSIDWSLLVAWSCNLIMVDYDYTWIDKSLKGSNRSSNGISGHLLPLEQVNNVVWMYSLPH